MRLPLLRSDVFKSISACRSCCADATWSSRARSRMSMFITSSTPTAAIIFLARLAIRMSRASGSITSISSLHVSNARLRYENRREDIDIALPVSTMDVAGSALSDRHQIQFDSTAGKVRVKNRAADVDRLVGDVDLGEDDLVVTKVQLETVGSTAELTGSISQFEAPQADLVVRAIVDAVRAAPLANIKDAVGGELTVDATAKGPLATPAVTARVSGSSLQFRELRDIELDAQAAYDSATRRTDVPSLRVRGPWGAVNGTGNVALDTSERSRLQATVDGLDAGQLMRALLLPYSAATTSRWHGERRVARPRVPQSPGKWPGDVEADGAGGLSLAVADRRTCARSRQRRPHRCATRARRRGRRTAGWARRRHRGPKASRTVERTHRRRRPARVVGRRRSSGGR